VVLATFGLAVDKLWKLALDGVLSGNCLMAKGKRVWEMVENHWEIAIWVPQQGTIENRRRKCQKFNSDLGKKRCFFANLR